MARWWGPLVLACAVVAASGCTASVARRRAEPRPDARGRGLVARASRQAAARRSPVRFASPPGHPLVDRTRYRFVGARPEEQILVECRPEGLDVAGELAERRARIESAGGRIESDAPLRTGSTTAAHLAFVVDERHGGASPTRTRIHWIYAPQGLPGCQPFLSVSAPTARSADPDLLTRVSGNLAAAGVVAPVETPAGYLRWQAGALELDIPSSYRLAASRRYVYESEDGRVALALVVGPTGRDDEAGAGGLEDAEVVARREVLLAGRATFEVDYRVAMDEGSDAVLLRVAEVELGQGQHLSVWARAPVAEAEHLERLWTQLLASIAVER